MGKTIRFRIRRQDRPGSEPYWQEFEIPYKPGHNVVSVLMEIRESPVTMDGKTVDQHPEDLPGHPTPNELPQDLQQASVAGGRDDEDREQVLDLGQPHPTLDRRQVAGVLVVRPRPVVEWQRRHPPGHPLHAVSEPEEAGGLEERPGDRLDVVLELLRRHEGRADGDGSMPRSPLRWEPYVPRSTRRIATSAEDI